MRCHQVSYTSGTHLFDERIPLVDLGDIAVVRLNVDIRIDLNQCLHRCVCFGHSCLPRLEEEPGAHRHC